MRFQSEIMRFQSEIACVYVFPPDFEEIQAFRGLSELPQVLFSGQKTRFGEIQVFVGPARAAAGAFFPRKTTRSWIFGGVPRPKYVFLGVSNQK